MGNVLVCKFPLKSQPSFFQFVGTERMVDENVSVSSIFWGSCEIPLSPSFKVTVGGRAKTNQKGSSFFFLNLLLFLNFLDNLCSLSLILNFISFYNFFKNTHLIFVDSYFNKGIATQHCVCDLLAIFMFSS